MTNTIKPNYKELYEELKFAVEDYIGDLHCEAKVSGRAMHCECSPEEAGWVEGKCGTCRAKHALQQLVDRGR